MSEECNQRVKPAGGTQTPSDDPSAGPSWSAVTAQFLEQHWQKLFLCMGAALVVVSSTLGARHLLGVQFGQPAVGCALALIYTLLLAGFGRTLGRWGAGAAERVVNTTVLLAVPVNFVLVGEMGLLRGGGVPGLLAAAFGAILLLALTHHTAARLAAEGGAWPALSLFAMAAANAAVSAGQSRAWGVAVLILLAWLFIAATWNLGPRAGRNGSPDSLVLGIIGLTFMIGAVRVGVRVVGPDPALYAVPVMLLSLACARSSCVSRGRLNQGIDALLLWAGHLLALTGFVLALARPPGPSALYSGNTLATALLGLGLFSAWLYRERRPLDLYLASASLIVVYFGAGYFLGDVMAAIESGARRALGYEHALPVPFKALNGLLFTLVLGAAGQRFAGRWSEAQLARHAYGLALTVAALACAVSCAEPKAAVLCLAGYGFLFLVASRVLREPRLIYAGCALHAGASFFAPGFTATSTDAAGWAAGLAGMAYAAAGLLAGNAGSASQSLKRAAERPWLISSTALALVGLPFALSSPGAMLVIASLFLLAIRPVPSVGWLYAALAAVAWGLGTALLPSSPDRQWIVAGVAAGYLLWMLGALTSRFKVALCTRLGLSLLPYERPFYNAAAVAGGSALVIRILGSTLGGHPPSEGLVLLPALALLSALMARPYPHRAWLDISVALLTAGILLSATRFAWWQMDGNLSPLMLLVAAITAHLWILLGLTADRVAAPLRRLFGEGSRHAGPVLRDASRCLLLLSLALAAPQVVWATLQSATGIPGPWPGMPTAQWLGMLGTLALAAAGCRLVLPEEMRSLRPSICRAILLGMLWWLGTPESPLLAVTGWRGTTFLPMVTAGAALLAATRLKSSTDAAVAALLAGLLTCGRVETATVTTLAVATVVFAGCAVRDQQLRYVVLGSVSAVACAIWSAMLAADVAAHPGSWSVISLGSMLGGFALLAGMVALDQRSVAGRIGEDPAFGRRAARRMEAVALSTAVLASMAFLADLCELVVGASYVGVGKLTAEARLSVASLVAIGVFFLLLAGRSGRSWQVYAGEIALTGSYLLGRWAFGLSPALDGVALLVISCLELGIGQLLARHQLPLYARPTLILSLLTPAISLAQALWWHRLDEACLLLLFSTATFYGVAGYQCRLRGVGYLAGALYNLFLWLAWIHIGWRLADVPQLFLVPVGVSAILLAEVNRAELGRDVANLIRGLSGLVIYVSSAIPMWQLESFGAWSTLLLLSLAGIAAGIGLRVQAFLGMGLVAFGFALLYPLGRAGLEEPLARWALMLALGLALILLVAVNERRPWGLTLQGWYREVRRWE